MTDYPLVSIITLNFNGSDDTRELLDSLKGITYPNIEILVIENGSTHKIFESYVKEYPEVNYVKSEKNLGFAGGNNLGIRQAAGKYVFLINNDVVVSPDFLEPLVDLMESDSAIGMVSPKILYKTNEEIIQYAGCKRINPYTGRGVKIGYREYDEGAYDKTEETGLVHGAAVMFRKDITNKIGLIPEIYFLYYEEYDWCEIARRFGYKLYFCGLSSVYHKGSASVGAGSPMKVYYMTRNRLLFIRRNFRGVRYVSSYLFFLLIALPKQTLFNLFRIAYLKAIYKGVIWNLNHQLQYESAGTDIDQDR